MQYTPKQLTENHNVSSELPLVSLLKLLGVSFAGLALLYYLLGFAVDFVAFSIPSEVEQQLTAQLAPKMASKPSDIRYELERQKLIKILETLTMNLPEKDRWHYQLKIEHSNDLNAFALPGGTIIFMSKTLSLIDDEDSRAFILAHELGHFVHKDILRGLGRRLVLGSAFALLFNGDNPVTRVLLGSIESSDLQFSREQEMAADNFALNLMTKSGYSNIGAIKVLTAFKAQETLVNYVLSFESTHPLSDQRLKNVETWTASNE